MAWEVESYEPAPAAAKSPSWEVEAIEPAPAAAAQPPAVPRETSKEEPPSESEHPIARTEGRMHAALRRALTGSTPEEDEKGEYTGGIPGLFGATHERGDQTDLEGGEKLKAPDAEKLGRFGRGGALAKTAFPDETVGPLSSLKESVSEPFKMASLSDIGTSVKIGLARSISGSRLSDLEEVKQAKLNDAKTPAQKRALWGDPDFLSLNDAIEQERATTREISADEQDVAARNPGFWQQASMNAAQSIAVSAPATAVGILTRNPELAAATMYAPTAGQTYSQLREQGVDPEKARRAAAVDGMLEVGTEVMPAKALFKQGTGPWKRAVNFLSHELPGESIAQVGQTLNEHLAALPNDVTAKDWLDGLKEGVVTLPQVAATVALSGGATVGGINLLNHAAQTATQRAAPAEVQPANPAELDALHSQVAPTVPDLTVEQPKLAAPVVAPAPPDFVVDEQGRVRHPDQPAPVTPLLEAPKGAGTFEAGSEGVREYTQAEERARQDAIAEDKSLGNGPVRVPATEGSAPVKTPVSTRQELTPEDRYAAMEAARSKTATPEQLAGLDGMVTKSGTLNPAGRRELTTLKRERAEQTAKALPENAGIYVEPKDGGFLLHVGDDSHIFYTSRQNADEDAAAAREARLKPGQVDVMGKAVTPPAQPTPAQAEAGNFRKPTVQWNGMTIALENTVGTTRNGTTAAGKPFSRVMQSDYGYVKGAQDTGDGHVDVFVGKHPESNTVFVIDQLTPDGKSFNEPKGMIGFSNEKAARAAYLANYQRGWRGIGAVTAMTPAEFKDWAHNGEVTKPLKWRPAEVQHAEQPAVRHESSDSASNRVVKPEVQPIARHESEEIPTNRVAEPETPSLEKHIEQLYQEVSAPTPAKESTPAPADITGKWQHTRHADNSIEVTKTEKGYRVDFGGGDVVETKGKTAQAQMQRLMQKEGFKHASTESPQFQRADKRIPSGKPTERGVRTRVNELLKGFAIRPRLTVVQSYPQLPQNVREAIEARGGKQGDMRALQYNGGTYFIADEISHIDQVQELVLHEVVTHFGLRSMLDNGQHEALLDELAKSMPMEVRRRGAEEFGDQWDSQNAGMRRIATEEAMAYYGQKYLAAESIPARIKRTIERWLANIRQFLREKMGLPAKFDQLYMKKLLQDLQAHLKSGEAMKAQTASAPMMQQKAPIFYSALTRAAETAKTAKASAAQWMATFKNTPGVKQDELDWSGVSDWLNSLGRPVTREELSDYLRANEIQIQDVMKGQNLGDKTSEIDRMTVELTALGYTPEYEQDHNVNTTVMMGIRNNSTGQRFTFEEGSWWDGANHDATDLLPQSVRDAAERLGMAQGERSALEDGGYEEPTATKYGQYTLPGGENYRELLLTLPQRDPAEAMSAFNSFQAELRAKYGDDDQVLRRATPGEVKKLNELGAPIREARDPAKVYRSSHWSEPNILAHVRFDERVDADGKRVLFIEEIQSDWHQQGRKRGYKDDPQILAAKRALKEKETELRRRHEIANHDLQVAIAQAQPRIGMNIDHAARERALVEKNRIELEIQDLQRTANDEKAVPAAPFKTTWPELAFKRMLRYAAEKGFDRIAWAPGQVQADRYDLSKQVDGIRVMSASDPDKVHVFVKSKGGTSFERYGQTSSIEKEKLPDVISKELALKALERMEAGEDPVEFHGLDLKVGGEGMIGFYDRQLPATINKMVKKWGAKVSITKVDTGIDKPLSWTAIDEAGQRYGILETMSVDITPAMRSAALEGLPLFSRTTQEETEAFNKQAAARRKLSIESGGGNYNIALENLSQQEIDTLQGVFDGLDSEVADQRRGTRKWSTTEQAALDMLSNKFGLTLDSLVNRKAGSTANAETLEAYGSLLISATKQMSQLAERAANTGANDDLLKLMMARERMGMLLAPAMGYRSEAGRALNILRKTAVQFQQADKLWEAMGDGTREAMTDFAKRVKQVGTVDQVIGLVRASYTPTWWDKFYEFWINGILSGPKTHAVNIVSNALMTGMEFSAHAIAAATSKHVSLYEIRARSVALAHGTSIGVVNAYQAFLTEEAQGDHSRKFETNRKAIGGILGRAVRIPGRLLTAEDEFFKSVSYHQELAGLAMREAVQINKSDPMPEFYKIMGNILNRRDLIDLARIKARSDTFQTPMGPITSAIARALDKSKVGRLIVPFIRTPTNILKSVAEYSPAAPLLDRVRDSYKEGGASWAVARSRIMIGSGVALGAFGLAMAGLLSGRGPDDKRERKILEATGWQPYSLRLGDTWVKYNRFDPLGTTLGLAADMYETSEYLTHDELQKGTSMLMASIALNLGDKSYLKGIADFSQAYSDPARYMQQYAQDLATSVIPNAVVQAAREVDPYEREARTLLESARSKIPLAREGLPIKHDLFGQPVKTTNFGWFIPLSVREQTNDPVAVAMLKLGVNKQMPDRRIRGVELSSEQYQQYAAYAGQRIYAEMLKTVSSKDFQNNIKQAPEEAYRQFDGQWNGIANAARAEWLQKNPDILKQVIQKRGASKSVGSHYLDDLTSRIAPLIDGKSKVQTVQALREAGHVALASLIEDMPAKPRSIVAKSLADLGANS